MPKPVTILTGFLGAGKTTFLNALLTHQSNRKFAIIENEFGEENIDNELITRSDGDLIEMNNGCLCCTLNDNLYEILTELHKRRDTFDELIIETTGIADPAGVALPFLADAAIGRAFELKRVVCLVDAQLLEDQLRDTQEAIKQISFADVVIINKTDTVAADYIPKIQGILEGINPFAKILVGNQNLYPIEQAFAIERTTNEPPQSESTPTSGHHHHHHHAHGDIVSLSFRFDEAFDLDFLSNRLTAFLMFQAVGVYRVKGILNVAGKSQKIVVQSVGRNLSIEGGAPWPEGQARVSRIVFIGKKLKAPGYEKMLRQCFSTVPTNA